MMIVAVVLYLLGIAFSRGYEAAIESTGKLKIESGLAASIGRWVCHILWPIVAFAVGCIDVWCEVQFVLMTSRVKRDVAKARARGEDVRAVVEAHKARMGIK